MPPIIPDEVPPHFPAGTTFVFSRAFDEYPAAQGWAYTIYLNGATAKFNKSATVQEDGSFLVVFLPSDTASLPPGAYRYAERLSNPGTQFALTGVAVAGGNGVYAFGSYSGPAPYVGMPVTITGFGNSGNNLVGAVVTALTGGPDGGTFTVVNSGAVNETLAALGVGPEQVFDRHGDELVINVEPNVASSPAGTFLSFAEQTLVVIEAAIAGRLTADIQSYQIAGRAVNKIPIEELMQLRGKYNAMVWREQHPGKLGQQYRVTFPPRGDVSRFPPTWVDITGLEQ